MRLLNSLPVLLTCSIFFSGCATYKDLCWGNINTKSRTTEIEWNTISLGSQAAELAVPGATLAGLAVGTAWNLASKTLHAAAATVNPNCYSNQSDSNPSDTPDPNSAEYNPDSIASNPNNIEFNKTTTNHSTDIKIEQKCVVNGFLELVS